MKRDFTICDLVADYRAPTPTAAAELVSPDLGQLKQRFDYLQDRIRSNTEKFIRSHQQTLDYQSSRLPGPVSKYISTDALAPPAARKIRCARFLRPEAYGASGS